MPIVASCECGKKLTVKDSLAGKKVRCPGCQQPLLIPAGAPPDVDDLETVEEPVAEKPRPKPPPRRDDDDDAPPPRKRPPADDDLQDEAPPPRKKSRDDDDDDEDAPPPRKKRSEDDLDDAPPPRKKRPPGDEDEDEDRPRRKRGPDDDDEDFDRPRSKKKMSTGRLIYLIAMGVVFLVLVGVFLFVFVLGGSPEKTLIGKWEIDEEATKATDPVMAVSERAFRIEFKDDGSMQGSRNGKWKVNKREGTTLEITLTHTRPEDIEIDVLEKNKIRWVRKSGGGGHFILKRSAG